MAGFLKQSTAITIRIGPFLSQSDGFTPVTAGTLEDSDIRLSRAGADFVVKADTTDSTHDEFGWWTCVLGTTDTSDLGLLTISVDQSVLTSLPVWHEFMVIDETSYEGLVTGTAFGTDNKVILSANTQTGVTIPTVTANSDMRGTDSAATSAKQDTMETTLNAASTQASVDLIQTDTTAILADTTVIGSTGQGLTSLSTQASVDLIQTDTTAILADTTVIGSTGQGLTSLSTQASVDLIQTDTTAILADTTVIGSTGQGLTSLSTQASVDAVKAETALIVQDTAVIGALGAGLTALATQASVDAVKAETALIVQDTAVIGALGAGLTALSTQASVDAIKAETALIVQDTAVIGALGAGLTALSTQASVDAIKAETALIVQDTAVIGALGAGLTALSTQASVDAVKAETALIVQDTAVIGALGAGLTALATQASVDTMQGNVTTILANSGAQILDTGTSQSTGTAAYIDLQGAVAQDNHYNKAIVVITGGTGAGQARTISDYASANLRATVDPAWVVNPHTDSTYVVLSAPTVEVAAGGGATAQQVWDFLLAGTTAGADRAGNVLDAITGGGGGGGGVQVGLPA